jgi:hypothetical protein
MSTVTAVQSPNQGLRAVQEGFCAIILPAVMRHAQVAFRDIRNPSRCEELTAEAVAIAWKAHRRLTARGKDGTQFPSRIAVYAASHARSGRRLCGQEKSKDVMSTVAQQRLGFTVGKLPDCSSLSGNPLEEALHDNTQTPVLDQVAFRLDFPRWLAALGDHHRRIAEAMALGHRTDELAPKFGLTPGRISQLRREYHRDWCRFHGEEEA